MSQLDPCVTVYADIDKVVVKPASTSDGQWIFAVPVDGSTYVLPPASNATGRSHVVKAFTQTVTVTATAGLIDGVSNAVITSPNSATFHSDGTNWYII